MTNDLIKDAIGAGSSPLGAEIELLDHELDEIAGGACQSFTCGFYRVRNADEA